jgi:hypothetical protein
LIATTVAFGVFPQLLDTNNHRGECVVGGEKCSSVPSYQKKPAKASTPNE